MRETKCLLCKSEAKIQRDGSRDMHYVMCPICGTYAVSGTLAAVAHSPDSPLAGNEYILSGLARELAEKDEKPPEFTTDNIKDLIRRYPVPDLTDIRAKARKLLDHLRSKSGYFGEMIRLDYKSDYPLAYAKNDSEFIALVKFLESEDLIGIRSQTNMDFMLSVTSRGWDLLKEFNTEFDQGFVAIWFDKSMDEATAAIEEAITEAGFKPLCIRHEHFSEKIMDKALGEIRRSRFVVVDLTANRPSVLFEAGFAHGLGLETVFVYREGETITGPLEFYARHYQCYPYKTAQELKETLKNAITARIKSRK